MTTNEGIACLAALSAVLDGTEPRDDDLTVDQWAAADRIRAAIPDEPASERDRLLAVALGYLIGDPFPLLARAERETMEAMLSEYKRSAG